MKTKIILCTLALGLPLCLLTAQDSDQGNGDRRPPPPGEGGPGGGGRGGPRGMPSPIIAALDLNHDGVIDASEIAQASQSLKTLDKNGDGKLTPDEYRPARMGGPGGPGGGPDGGGRPPRPAKDQ